MNVTRDPRTISVIAATGKVTFLEIISDKVLYNIVLCSFLLLGLGFLASRLTYIRPDRVVLDFGLTAIGLSCGAIAVFNGAGLLGREIERRTIHLVLSRPVSRGKFLWGKFAGLSAVVFLNWILLSISFLIILFASSAEETYLWSNTLGIGLCMILVQSLMIAAITLWISTFSTTSLTVIISLGVYLIGNNISQLRLVAAKTRSPVGSWILNAFAALLPNLESFNLGVKVTYGLPVSAPFVISGFLYGMVVIILSLTLGGFFIRSREV